MARGVGVQWQRAWACNDKGAWESNDNGKGRAAMAKGSNGNGNSKGAIGNSNEEGNREG